MLTIAAVTAMITVIRNLKYFNLNQVVQLSIRFGVSIGFTLWTLWIWLSFALSDEPIERYEILELIYFSVCGFWFIQHLIQEATLSIADRDRDFH